MSIKHEEEVLHAAIQNLEFSNNFKEKSRLMGFSTLLEITETIPENLVNAEGFDYNWLGELVTYLMSRKLLHKLQPTPGNNPG